MGEFSILTNRKRALIALAHSIVFLLIATRQIVGVAPARGIWTPASVSLSTWIVCGILAIVSAILLWLFTISRGWLEKIYFGLCVGSATSGLVRIVVGDRGFHAGLYVRVIFLATAVLVGIAIVRVHSDQYPVASQ